MNLQKKGNAIKILIFNGICMVAMLLIQTSCFSKQPDENNIPINSSVEKELGLPISIPSEALPQLTDTPEIEPTPTPTPTPMPNPLNLTDDLNVSGTIWVMDVGDEFTNIVKLDLTNHTVEINTYQLFCKGMVTKRADAICQESPESEFLIINLETGLSSIVAEVDNSMIAAYIDNHFFVGLTSNSTGITYYFIDLDSDAEYFFFLDHDNNIAGAPRISPDGEFIINTKSFGSGDYRLMLYDPIKEINTQISGDNQYISNYFSWSPVNTHLVYGVADYRSEIGNPANQYYLFSLESWESKFSKSQI